MFDPCHQPPHLPGAGPADDPVVGTVGFFLWSSGMPGAFWEEVPPPSRRMEITAVAPPAAGHGHDEFGGRRD